MISDLKAADFVPVIALVSFFSESYLKCSSFAAKQIDVPFGMLDYCRLEDTDGGK